MSTTRKIPPMPAEFERNLPTHDSQLMTVDDVADLLRSNPGGYLLVLYHDKTCLACRTQRNDDCSCEPWGKLVPVRGAE